MEALARQRSQAMSRVLKALAHPVRLWMVERLAEGECCVCDLAAMAEADFSSVSRHLAQLRQVGVLADRRQGKQVFYRLKAPCLPEFLHCIESVTQGRGLVSTDDLRAGAKGATR